MSKRDLIAGFDPAYRIMGWGLVSAEDGSPVDCGIFDLLTVNTDYEERLREFVRLSARLPWERIAAMATERQYLRRDEKQDPRAVIFLAESKGWIQAAGALRGVPYITHYYSQEWKSSLGIAPNASKKEVKAAIELLLRSTESGWAEAAYRDIKAVLRDNAADALGIAGRLWGEYQQRQAMKRSLL